MPPSMSLVRSKHVAAIALVPFLLLGCKDAAKEEPATVAKAGYDAMLAGKDHVVAPLPAKFKAAVATLLPDGLLTKITRAD